MHATQPPLPPCPLAHAPSSPTQTSPISRLPNELFVYIINLASAAHAAALPSYHASASDTRPRLNPAVAASSVCRHWNAALRDNPTVWSTLRLDGQLTSRRMQAKVRWWVAKATASALPHEGVDDEFPTGDPRFVAEIEPARRTRPGLGIGAIVLTRAQHLGEHGLRSLLDLLVTLDAIPALRSFHISWMGPASTSALAQHQITTTFVFLSKRACTTLQSLTLHTPTHLRLLFSLPRFGAHFASLTNLELRSAKLNVPADNLYVPPDFLPDYEGEDDWPPTMIARLVLVGPVWRLRFEDGTLASPTVAKEDCPKLDQLELSQTTPPVGWDLLSAPGLKTITLSDHLDQPTLPDPKVVDSLPRVQQLSLVRSAALATRLLNLAVAQTVAFHHLTSVNLRSATLSSAQLALFATPNAPNLRELHLANTAALQLPATPPTMLTLPACQRVTVLDVSAATWLDESIDQLAVAMPALERVNMSGTEVGSRAVLEWVRSTLKEIDGVEGEAGKAVVWSRLVELNLVGCGKLEAKAVEWLRARIRPGGFRYAMVRADEDKRLARYGGQW